MGLDETLRVAAGGLAIMLGAGGVFYAVFAAAAYERIYNRENKLRKQAMDTGQSTIWPLERPSIPRCIYEAVKPRTLHEEYFV